MSNEQDYIYETFSKNLFVALKKHIKCKIYTNADSPDVIYVHIYKPNSPINFEVRYCDFNSLIVNGVTADEFAKRVMKDFTNYINAKYFK